jgi:hypothetical protein
VSWWLGDEEGVVWRRSGSRYRVEIRYRGELRDWSWIKET